MALQHTCIYILTVWRIVPALGQKQSRPELAKLESGSDSKLSQGSWCESPEGTHLQCIPDQGPGPGPGPHRVMTSTLRRELPICTGPALPPRQLKRIGANPQRGQHPKAGGRTRGAEEGRWRGSPLDKLETWGEDGEDQVSLWSDPEEAVAPSPQQ